MSTGANASLFHGAPGLEFVLSRAGQDTRSVRDATDRVVRARLGAAQEQGRSGVLPTPAQFDLIRGLTGLGAVLLTRETTSPLLPQILAYLVRLAWPVDFTGHEVPGWWSSTGPCDEEMPGGHANLGVAHGVAGPLALLSLAARRGYQVPGQMVAIEVMTGWLEQYRGGYWITLGNLSSGPEDTEAPSSRPSWCYGELGLLRSRHLACFALGDSIRAAAVEAAAVDVLTDSRRLRLVTDASLCHGWAGLLTVARSMASDSLAPDEFARPISDIQSRLAHAIDQLDKPGFLEGRAGAQLTLDGHDTTGWTRALLIN
ncbi:Lanthionine synthetase C-like protein [Streptacidiphilus jiangxiensis]|uniref:Lanthionine synthetase C-like protein n=1 Tax=Streptacidiphilus jiangxiensis TaxID=235985 RepID=A0A1H7H3S8_STRJI|nr:Lanthionine synthetase C-like protein [Streptacidiphilus jiangxiensis]